MTMYPYQPDLVPVYGENWQIANFPQPASSGEGTRDETDGVVDAQEQRTGEIEDTFGLEFAAIQWLNLVTNAEQLFNKLLHSIVLTGDEKEQIQRWLCLKQECEECVASDEATSLGEHHRHSLERIEELTEGTEHTDDLSDENVKSSDSQYESDTESDFDCHLPDFEEKLDSCMECFKDKTDMLIRSKLEEDEIVDETDESLNKSVAFNVSTSLGPNYSQTGRRKSLHPGSFQLPPSLMNLSRKKSKDCEDSDFSESFEAKKNEFSNLALVNQACSTSLTESTKEFKTLLSSLEIKKNKVKQISVNLKASRKRIHELQQTIVIKKQSVKELRNNIEARSSAKTKFNKKHLKLELEYHTIKSQIKQIELSLQNSHEAGSPSSLSKQAKGIEDLKKLAKKCEGRLKNIKTVKQIAGDSVQSIPILEEEIEKLKNEVAEEENRKQKFEEELLKYQEEIKNDEKLNSQGKSRTKKKSETENDRLRLMLDETERLAGARDSSRKLHNFFQQTMKQKNKTKSSSEEKYNLDKFEEKDEKAHREEIINLRKTRDSLVDQRSSINEKYHKEKRLSSSGDRKKIVYDETIEAIDTVIEYKNELICGRKSVDSVERRRREQGEQVLFDRLFKGSSDEIRALLYKYFHKVIDLRESGGKMERQLYELERENEKKNLYIQQLSLALQMQCDIFERERVTMQRSHQEKLNLLIRQFAEESGSSGTEAKKHLAIAEDSDLNKYKRENKHLKKRLQELEALLKMDGGEGSSSGIRRIRSRSASPNPKSLQLKSLPAPAASFESTSRVHREKNKVILRLDSTKKKEASKDLLSFCKQK